MRKRLNTTEVLRGIREKDLEVESWSNNVVMNHNLTVQTRPGLRTLLPASGNAIPFELPPGERCTPYSYQIPSYDVFGKQPLTFAMTSVSCLTMSSSGLLSGTPCTAGTFLPTITIVNADGFTFRLRVKLVIADYIPVILLPGEV